MNRKVTLITLGPLAVIITGVFLFVFGARYVHTDNAYIKADKTNISAEVSGRVLSVNIRDNTRVVKGQTLFTIDPEPFQISAGRAQANMHNVHADVEGMLAEYTQKVAQLGRIEENLRYRKSEYKRYNKLDANAAVSKEKISQVLHEFNTATKEFEFMKKELETLKAKLGGDPDIAPEEHPYFKRAKCEYEKTLLDLSKVNVVAPADGIVANLNTHPGEYTAVGLPMFALVDDKSKWIEANFKETDLTNMQLGQQAEIRVDAYPDQVWHAKIVSITPATGSEFSILPAQNSSGNWVKVVQRVMVRLEFDNNDPKFNLVAGMSVKVKVDTEKNRLQRIFGNRNLVQR